MSDHFEVSPQDEYDVIVVGLGLAGASAALQAAEAGAKVLVIERYSGGGTSALSAGVMYSGGGTRHQIAAGHKDTPDNMYAYLKREVLGAVSDQTLRRFCDSSVENLDWLEQHGVRFGADECPFKTSYPPFRYCLYYSGNETEPPFNQEARPEPRGHIPLGSGQQGARIMKPLIAALAKKGVEMRLQTQVRSLITDDSGRVVGVNMATLKQDSLMARLHAFLYWLSIFTRYLSMTFPFVAAALKALTDRVEKRAARSATARARKGVILAAGGFVFNRAMIAEYAPAFNKALPLGSIGDDGGGIRLGQSVGGKVDRMERVSAWRFLNPPETFTQGVLVNRRGERICNERLYGAQVTRIMIEQHRSEGVLIIDHALWKRSFAMLASSRATWFQQMLGFPCLILNRRANSIGALAKKIDMPADTLQATIDSYNQVARQKGPDPMGKLSSLLTPIEQAPFYAIESSINDAWFGCPSITMGGLVVDEQSGEVQRQDGSTISGLYAAGRAAVGIPTENYVSGLSLADCVFSGRRAGQHAARDESLEPLLKRAAQA